MKLSEREIAGLKSRAITAVGRAMPKPLLLRLIGEEWHEEIVMSVYKGMTDLAITLKKRMHQPAAGRGRSQRAIRGNAIRRA